MTIIDLFCFNDINTLFVLFIGLFAGFLSGLLGIGGGFIAVPMLIIIGVPPEAAVAASTMQMIASSSIGIIARVKQKEEIDFVFGGVLAIFGILGATIGLLAFNAFLNKGNLEFIISILYVIFTISVSCVNFKNLFSKPKTTEEKDVLINPFRMNFKTSGIECSALIPAFYGCVAGFLAVMIGVGGGFILVPTMLAIGMHHRTAVGTSLIEVFVVTVFISFIHKIKTGVLDLELGFALIVSAAIGSLISSSIKIKNEKTIHFMLGIITLLAGINFGMRLIVN